MRKLVGRNTAHPERGARNPTVVTRYELVTALDVLPAFAGCIAEDLAPAMVSRGGDRMRIQADILALQRAAERLAALAQATEVLLPRHAEEPTGNLEDDA